MARGPLLPPLCRVAPPTRVWAARRPRQRNTGPVDVTAPGSALSSRESTTRKEQIMRVFAGGAPGARGRPRVPGRVGAGHEVTATTRTPGKTGQLREAGAVPVVLDGLDREAVIEAVRAAAPEVIVHQMTALAGMRSLRNPDKAFAVTNELRTRGTDNLLAA